MLKTPSHIIVGLSGGVDSAVAAYLLKTAGHHVQGIFMKNWEEEENGFCPAEKELHDAQEVCHQLNIEFHAVNFAEQYWQKVFVHFLDEFQAGRTPNPDILCNKEIKFNAFLNYAKGRGADYIATGHYARCLSAEKNLYALHKGKDVSKDQSYFLHALNQSQLAQSLFPLGGMTKQQVRLLAKKIGLKNHAKKDSTGICFIGERKFKRFLSNYLPAKPGDIITLDGQKVGRHEGLMFYTIGQRQGLAIGGKKNHAELPWYVAEKNLKENKLIVVQGKNHPALLQTSLNVKNLSWIAKAPSLPCLLHAKIRYRQTDQPCLIKPKTPGYLIEFQEPQRAITPGQSIVFYAGDECLGGGIIDYS